MLRLASFFLLIGIGSEISSSINQTGTSGLTQLLGFVSLSLFLIFLILGLPATRKLLN